MIDELKMARTEIKQDAHGHPPDTFSSFKDQHRSLPPGPVPSMHKASRTLRIRCKYYAYQSSSALADVGPG